MADDQDELGGGGGGENPALPPIPVPGMQYSQTSVASGYPGTYDVSQWYSTTAAQPWASTVAQPVQQWTGSLFYPASPGWVCPGCGQGYSPMVAACWHCVPKPPATEEESGEEPPAEEQGA